MDDYQSPFAGRALIIIPFFVKNESKNFVHSNMAKNKKSCYKKPSSPLDGIFLRFPGERLLVMFAAAPATFLFMHPSLQNSRLRFPSPAGLCAGKNQHWADRSQLAHTANALRCTDYRIQRLSKPQKFDLHGIVRFARARQNGHKPGNQC